MSTFDSTKTLFSDLLSKVMNGKASAESASVAEDEDDDEEEGEAA